MKTILVLLACAMPLAAQNDPRADSAKATAIVARHTAAMGGVAAFNVLKQAHTVMMSSMPGEMGGGEVRSEMYVKSPNLVRIKMDMPGIGQMEMGYDGKTAWSVSAAAGPAVHDDIPQNLLNAADILGAPLKGLKVSYLGRREIGGRQYDAVRALLPDGQHMTHYFDMETGLLAGMDPEGAPPPPAGRMTMSFTDYKRFGGVLQATKVTIMNGTKEMVIRTVSMSHAPFDAKIFAPPPAVQQLLDKKPQQR